MSQRDEFGRKFVKAGDALQNWEQIAPYFDQLRDRPIDNGAALEQWLLDYSELAAAVAEVGTDRYVKMTCQTDDAERKQAYLDYVENIEPNWKMRANELDIKYVNSPAAKSLLRDRYHVLDRSLRRTVEMFRPENVPLQTEETKLEQQYQEISGAQTVHFDGKEQTLQHLALYAERVERDIRQAAWEAEWNRRLQDKDKLNDIFDQLVQVRHKIARNADCADYREYAFKAKQRFDYGPEDCIAFHQAVEKAVVPAVRELQRRRKDALKVDRLRPWDLSVDIKGRPPLRPFQTPDELCQKASRVFHRVDPELGRQFDEMQANDYLDLDSRKGKAPGGYQSTYEEARRPFIFMNAVGVQRDVSTLIHEGGHAFHCVAARHDPILMYRSSPIEFAEVASMGMEMLALDCLDEFYQEDDLGRARRSELEGALNLFPWVATIDAFQHWIYAHPEHQRDQRTSEWTGLLDRFGGITDFAGYEDARASRWHKQLHLFEVPFYYIEYAIAQLGALQVWHNAKKDKQSAVAKYNNALSLGGSRPLPELFAAAGAKFDFSYDTLAPLVESVQNELAGMD